MSLPYIELLDHAVKNYQEVDTSILDQMDKVSLFKKGKNEVQLTRLANQLLEDLTPYRNKTFTSITTEELKQVRNAFLTFMTKQDRKNLLYDLSFLELFMKVGYFEAADGLFARASKNDGELQTSEVFQGLRNFWIMNSLQMYFDNPVKRTDSIYAFSLLYPYTDNFLDDTKIEVEEKELFNQRLDKYISGKNFEPDNFLESRIFKLFDLIENQYDRSEYPKIYESIELLQNTQKDSMKQYDEEALSRDELLRIVFLKGGSTVMTDAFLVKGDLSKNEMQFAFNYGSLLQMLDDFEDAIEDFNEGHQTLFSTQKRPLDDEVERLIGYMFKVTEETSADTEVQKFLKEVIRTCAFLLISDTIGRNTELISKKFYKTFQTTTNVRLSFYNKLKNYLETLLTNFDLSQPIGQKSE